MGHGGELSEKESDSRYLLIGVAQIICLRGEDAIDWFHQQIQRYKKNCTVPGSVGQTCHVPGKMSVV